MSKGEFNNFLKVKYGEQPAVDQNDEKKGNPNKKINMVAIK